jgi:restriction system protein
MAMPTYQELMLPILKLVAQGFKTQKSTREPIYSEFSMTEDEIKESLSGGAAKIVSRINWAFIYLLNAELIKRTSRGEYEIAQQGVDLLSSNPEYIDRKYLFRYDSFKKFFNKWKENIENKDDNTDDINQKYDIDDEKKETPDEAMEKAYNEIIGAELGNLKDAIISLNHSNFEKLVLKVMEKLDYGVRGALKHTGGSGDGGFDGIITEDRLGLNKIYLQAKHYTKENVGRPEIQSFAGAMDGEGATRGVFVTTSSFTKEAIQWVNKSPKTIRLIDGDLLVSLMYDRAIGLRMHKQYAIYRVDKNFFEDIEN